MGRNLGRKPMVKEKKQRCEFAGQPCDTGLKICSEMAYLCKRRLKGMTDEEIDELWHIPEKFRVIHYGKKKGL